MAVEGAADVQTDTLGATGVQVPAPTLWQRPGFKPRRRLESELSGSQQVDKHVTAVMYVWPSIEGPPLLGATNRRGPAYAKLVLPRNLNPS